MQSGIDSSRLRIAREQAEGGVTRIDIRPEGEKSFFGADGASFRDVLDAINPLNHIPIVSDLMKDATGHSVSTASRLVGGALIGGPIGFVASLASIIFEGETGQSPAGAVYAALTGQSGPDISQIAANEATPAPLNEEQVASADETVKAAETVPVQVASLAPAARPPASLPVSSPIPGLRTDKDRAVLDLYGNSTSALDAYKKAQLLPYLRAANRSEVL